jgi:hypothetical protein
LKIEVKKALSLDQAPANAAINLSRFAEHSSSVPLPHRPEIFMPPQKRMVTIQD